MTEVAMNAPAEEAGVIVTADAPVDVAANDELGAIFDKYERDNGAGRDDKGRFASDRAKEAVQAEGVAQEPVVAEVAQEGATAEEQAAAQAAQPISIPPTMASSGLDEVWSALPPEAQEAIAAQQMKLHKTLSDHGRFVSAYRPVAEVFGEFKEYFGGDRGNYKPDEAVKFLFGLQRSMDDKPMETLLEIADTYNLLPELQKRFGTAAAGEGQQEQASEASLVGSLRSEIESLKGEIRRISDPSSVDERINARLSEDRVMTEATSVISRVATKEAMPLYNDVEPELPHFITRAWNKLGESADKADVLKLAYDMAVNADPDLRKKAAALTSAAQTERKVVADARKANATNIRSTSSGSPREMTEDEALDAIWDKHKRA